jgi:hypothetical protein
MARSRRRQQRRYTRLAGCGQTSSRQEILHALVSAYRGEVLQMALSGNTSLHRRLSTWFTATANGKRSGEYNAWILSGAVLTGTIYLALAVIVSLVINIGALPCGVYVEPVWRAEARFRFLTFTPRGIPIIAVAAPSWIAVAVWRAWTEHGALYALGPFVVTPLAALGLIAALMLVRRFQALHSRKALR